MRKINVTLPKSEENQNKKIDKSQQDQYADLKEKFGYDDSLSELKSSVKQVVDNVINATRNQLRDGVPDIIKQELEKFTGIDFQNLVREFLHNNINIFAKSKELESHFKKPLFETLKELHSKNPLIVILAYSQSMYQEEVIYPELTQNIKNYLETNKGQLLEEIKRFVIKFYLLLTRTLVKAMPRQKIKHWQNLSLLSIQRLILIPSD